MGSYLIPIVFVLISAIIYGIYSSIRDAKRSKALKSSLPEFEEFRAYKKFMGEANKNGILINKARKKVGLIEYKAGHIDIHVFDFKDVISSKVVQERGVTLRDLSKKVIKNLDVKIEVKSPSHPNYIINFVTPNNEYVMADSDHYKYCKKKAYECDNYIKSVVIEGKEGFAGWTDLMVAADEGQVEVIQDLLSSSEELNQKNAEGETALFLATRRGYIEIAESILNHGADPNCKNNDEQPLLSILASRESTKGDIKFAELVISKGADINAIGKDGKSALIVAVENNNQKIVKLLLSKNANLSLKDESGETAIGKAQKKQKR